MEFEDNRIELINCLSISEVNNDKLATGNFSGEIFIWEIETNEFVTSFQAHYQGVLQLIYDEKTNYLISSSFDSRVKIHECESYTEIHNFHTHLNPVQSLVLQVNYN